MLTDRNFGSDSKFTKGEKCIFAHLVITFVAIIIIVMIYFVHVASVMHLGDDLYRIDRRSQQRGEQLEEVERSGGGEAESAFRCAGAAFVGSRAACGAALVRARWSLAPAHCVAARARPLLAPALPHWTLRYGPHATGVRRGVVQPRCDAAALPCDVGLFEHERALAAPVCVLPSAIMDEETLRSHSRRLHVVGRLAGGGRMVRRVRPLPAARCAQFAALVAERPPPAPAPTCHSALLRSAAPQEKHLPGAVLFVGSQMVGMSSWGDARHDTFPFIIANIAPFNDWLETTMSLG